MSGANAASFRMIRDIDSASRKPGLTSRKQVRIVRNGHPPSRNRDLHPNNRHSQPRNRR